MSLKKPKREMSSRRQNGSLRRRKSGAVWTWLGLWWEEGHRRAKTIGACKTMSKAQAGDRLAKLMQAVNERHGHDEYNLANFINSVVFPWYRRAWKESTALTTEGRVRLYIIGELGQHKLSVVDRVSLQEFLDEKAVRGLSYSTVAHLRWDLRQIFRMAVNDGLLPRNPAELLHIPRAPRPERQVLSIEQVSSILAALSLRDRTIIKLTGIAGMRPGEVFGLQWADIQPDGIHITRRIYRGKIGTPKSHLSVRTAAITHNIRRDLDAWKEFNNRTKPQDWVFPSENPNMPLSASNFWRRNIHPTLQQAGLAWVNFQVLRRTAVTLLNAHGTNDPATVAAQCGHALDVSLNIYNKIGITKQQEAINQLDRAITSRP